MSDFTCNNCGDERDTLLGGEGVHKCSTVTENEELRELVDKWRRKVSENTLPQSGLTGEGRIYQQCADELEELIND